MASERRVRALSEELVGDNLAGEEVPLSQPLRFGVDLKLSPLVYVPDFVGKVYQLLEQNNRYTKPPCCRHHTYTCMYKCVIAVFDVAQTG